MTASIWMVFGVGERAVTCTRGHGHKRTTSRHDNVWLRICMDSSTPDMVRSSGMSVRLPATFCRRRDLDANTSAERTHAIPTATAATNMAQYSRILAGWLLVGLFLGVRPCGVRVLPSFLPSPAKKLFDRAIERASHRAHLAGELFCISVFRTPMTGPASLSETRSITCTLLNGQLHRR